MRRSPVLKVAVPVPVRRLFDYLGPDDQTLEPGSRVVVPYGRRKLTGVVFEISSGSTVDPAKLKPVHRLIDETPLIDQGLLNLLRWAAGYYHHPLGEAVKSVLPGFLSEESAAATPVRFLEITPSGISALTGAARLGTRQRQVLHALASGRRIRRQKVPAFAGLNAVLKGLKARGWILESRQDHCVIETLEKQAGPELNRYQREASEQIRKAGGEYRAMLLHGITGSGKTEVYLDAVNRTIDAGRQALILVPEIGLTPQTVERFRSRTGASVVVYHSGLTRLERNHAWWSAAEGTADVILGTRSAVFSALKRPGILIVDEEHDSSYKQQDGFRYHARDLTVLRARMQAIPVILGSATPSVESEVNCRAGRYYRLSLPVRAGQARLPDIEIISTRDKPVENGFSGEALKALADNTGSGRQSLVFINRRGFAPVVMCHHCDWQAHCSRCDARLVLHRGHSGMVCHHCGESYPRPVTCPQCGSDKILDVGEGTQRIEEFLQSRFDGARVIRVDRDSVRGRSALSEKLARVRDGDADILVGTQMLTKGHDFPGVTLVVVLQADHGLFSVDFKAPEALFQQIVQVSGRAGRSSRRGRVLVQTGFPEHPLIRHVRNQDYTGFVNDLLQERKSAGFPPYRYLVLFRSEAHQSGPELEMLEQIRGLAVASLETSVDVDVLWPVPAPMARRQGRHRGQLLISAGRRKDLQHLLSAIIPKIENLPLRRKTRWSVDVDPVDLY